MIRHCFIRLWHLCIYGNQHSARFLLALAETIWAVTLLWPGDTFSRPTYDQMAALMSEEAWAVVFLLTAACQWAILLCGRYHIKPAVLFSGWNMLLWWYVTTSMYLSVYPPPAAISGELALAIGATWVYLKSGFCVGRRKDD